MRRILLAAPIFVLLGCCARAQDSAPGKVSVATGPSEVKIDGAVNMPFVARLADLKKMPRKTLRVDNAHAGKAEVYEGVLVADLLKKAGVPQGEALRGKAMASYVLVEAADNYRVVFALAELNSSFQDSDVILADTMDGVPLAPDEGPLKLVGPHDKRPARWTKMVKSLTVVRVPD